MKLMLFLLSFFTWISMVVGQPTLSNAYFPAVNDTLRSVFDGEAFGLDLQTTGGPKTWDFTSLGGTNNNPVVYRPASEGANVAAFTGATHVVFGANGSETYYKSTPAQFLNLGYNGPDPGGLGVNINAKFDPPLVVRKAPLNFFDIDQYETNLTLPFSIEQLPDSLVPIPGLDSIRIRINIKQLNVVDGYGSLAVPGSPVYDVLRQKRTETTETKLDVKSILGWTEIPAGTFGGVGAFLGKDTTVSYAFLSEGIKENIANVNAGSLGTMVESASYKYFMISALDEAPEDSKGMPFIGAFPNPAVDKVSFECRNIANGAYTLSIFNLIGKLVWKNEYFINKEKSILVDLGDMKKGTYLYSLRDKKGKVISTKRLVVIKP